MVAIGKGPATCGRQAVDGPTSGGAAAAAPAAGGAGLAAGSSASGSDGPASGGAVAIAPAAGGVGLAAGSGLCQRYMPAAGPRREAPFLDCEEPEAEEPTLAEAVEELSRQARVTQHWQRFLSRALRLDHRRRCWAQQGQWLAAIRCRGRGHDHHLLR